MEPGKIDETPTLEAMRPREVGVAETNPERGAWRPRGGVGWRLRGVRRAAARVAVATSMAAFVSVVTIAGASAATDAPVDDDDPIARSARGRTIAHFDDIARAERGFGLRAWVNDGAGTAIPIGSELSYHFEAEGPAYLTVVHLDSHGVATLLLPNGVSGPAGAGRKVAAGGRQSFPARTDGFSLRAEPPVGQEHVIVVATAGPIDVDALGVPAGPDGFTVREAADAPALASRLLDLYLATPVAERAAVHVEQHITGRPGESEYTSVDIVDYFTTRTRSIQRPRLDLHIHFATNSDTLDATALQGLDEVADALRDPRMRDMRFTVAGHTDDTGTPDYNASLSKRRATSVVRYLSDSQGIDPERLEVDFHGEARPLESNATDDGRKLNRRVEFELRR